MAITQAVCNSFKVEILKGLHNFTATTGNTFKLALYDNEATLSKSTTAYAAPTDASADPTSTYEVTTTSSGYTGGGNTLVASADPTLSGDTACVKFNDTTWGSSASFTARGCLIYNTTSITGFTTNRAVCAINFGADKTVTSGTFTIQFPAQTAGNAIIQIA